MQAFLRRALVVLVACGDGGDTDTTPTDQPTPVPTLTMSGNISTWPGFAPAAGADVCFRSASGVTCSTTDASGNYTLAELAVDTTGGVRIAHPDLVTTWIPIVLGTEDLDVSLGVDGPSIRDAYYADAGVTPTAGRVVVTLQATAGPPMWQGEPGAVPTLAPPSGQGPFFLDSSGSIETDATATTGLGVAVFLDVDPAAGPFTMSFNAAACQAPQMGVGIPTLDVPPDVEAVFFQYLCTR